VDDHAVRRALAVQAIGIAGSVLATVVLIRLMSYYLPPLAAAIRAELAGEDMPTPPAPAIDAAPPAWMLREALEPTRRPSERRDHA
jgi:hypothetical protein